MKDYRVFSMVLFAGLLCTVLEINAASIYKYRLADGSILYSQKRTGSGTLLAIIDVPSPTSQQNAESRAAERKLQQQIARADRLSEQRAAREAQAEIDINIGTQVVGQDHLFLPYGRTPLPGERQGTGRGTSRLNEAYWNRMRLLGLLDQETPVQADCARPQMIFAQ